jgi:uncharacterized phage infection (PIP) family protein YhgE
VALAGLMFVAPPAGDVVRHWVLMTQQARLNRHRDRFVDASELNEYCQALLRRAQQAIDKILGSRVVAAGVLEHMRVTNLPECEWKLAIGLREITKLQAKIPSDTRQFDSETADKVADQKRLLREARIEYSKLVDSLEKCSTQIAKADQGFVREQRKQQETDENLKRALDLSSGHDRYIDLRADTEKVSATIDEIADLTDEATNLGQQLRDIEAQDN